VALIDDVTRKTGQSRGSIEHGEATSSNGPTLTGARRPPRMSCSPRYFTPVYLHNGVHAAWRGTLMFGDGCVCASIVCSSKPPSLLIFFNVLCLPMTVQYERPHNLCRVISFYAELSS